MSQNYMQLKELGLCICLADLFSYLEKENMKQLFGKFSYSIFWSCKLGFSSC